MSTSIRRIQPEAALQPRAVRPVGARRNTEREFDQELDQHTDDEVSENSASPETDSGAPVQAPRSRPNEDVGSQLDVLG